MRAIETDAHARVDLSGLAEEIRLLEQEARDGQRRPIEIQLAIGERLIEAKRSLPHGDFLRWLELECKYSREHAWRLMFLSRNVARVQHLSSDISLRAALAAIASALRPGNRPVRPVADIELPEFVPCFLEVGDAAALPLPNDVVDLIVTSPPYGLGVDYADGDGDHARDGYQAHSLEWAAEMYRVARPQGRLCLNVPLDTTLGGPRPVYADWLAALREVGWEYETTVIWNEGNVSRSVARGSVDSPSAPHVMAPVETIIVCHKGDWNLGRVEPHDLLHEDWLAWTNGLWSFPGASSTAHPAPFPEELPRRCISLLSFRDAVVCDPFVGSGTTAVVAYRLGRTFYGFDVSAHYVALARARVAREIAA